MLMTSSSSGINNISPIIVGSVGFTTNVPKSTSAKTYHIQNQQFHQQNQATNGFIGKSRDTFMTSNNSIMIRNGSSNSNMPEAVDNGKYRTGSTTATIDNNNDTTSNGTCIILPSMTINSQSKTPYSDATQVSILWRGDK